VAIRCAPGGSIGAARPAAGALWPSVIPFIAEAAAGSRISFVAVATAGSRIPFVAVATAGRRIPFIAEATARRRISFVAVATARCRITFVAVATARCRISFVAVATARCRISFVAVATTGSRIPFVAEATTRTRAGALATKALTRCGIIARPPVPFARLVPGTLAPSIGAASSLSRSASLAIGGPALASPGVFTIRAEAAPLAHRTGALALAAGALGSWSPAIACRTRSHVRPFASTAPFRSFHLVPPIEIVRAAVNRRQQVFPRAREEAKDSLVTTRVRCLSRPVEPSRQGSNPSVNDASGMGERDLSRTKSGSIVKGDPAHRISCDEAHD